MKSKKLYFILAALLVYLFAAIFVTVALTGGRDTPDFTSTDWGIFAVFMTLEIAATVLLFVVAYAIGKSARGTAPIPKKEPISPYQKAIMTRDFLLIGISVIISFASNILGTTLLIKKIGDNVFAITLLCIFAIAVILFAANTLGAKLLSKRFNSKNREDVLNFIYSHREHAEKSARKLSKKLHALLKLTSVYTVLIGLLGIILALVSYTAFPFVFIAALLIYAALSRIQFPSPKVLFTEDNGYVTKNDYPELYKVAHEAAAAVGVGGEINICLQTEFEAGIRKFGKNVSIQLGALLCNIMSREELKSILLHECAHLGKDTEDFHILHDHHCFLDEKSEISKSLYPLVARLFAFPDSLFVLNYILYTYASTIGDEEKADKAMITHGEARYAGSAFLKLKYMEMYNWESGSYDTESSFIEEELKPDMVKKELINFSERLALRKDAWNKLIDVEIISRAATHPTVKMRLDAIGHTDYSLCESNDSEAYKSEQKKAIDYVDDRICEMRKEVFESERKEYYLDPLNTVTQWEESGKTIIPDSYRTVVFALRQLGRVGEADELCNRVIDTLPNSANHYAHFIKGCTLLHSFDESGIEHIYQAIESNHNYIDEGMRTIGQFCCIAGKQDDLDTYRERVLKMAADQDEKYSELDHISTKDNLTKEELPEDIRRGLFTLISENRDTINEVYLVRKIITDDYFASAVIVDFKADIDDEIQAEVMDKFFLFLDSQDWDFTLFDSKNVPMNAIKSIYKAKIYPSENATVF